MRWIRNLSELSHEDLPSAGGKSANLGELIRGGLPVPPGFCILTDAYREAVRRNDLEEKIHSILAVLERADPEALESAAEKIRTLFAACRVPPDVAEEIRAAYRSLDPAGDSPVAVRSSATAEDLPDMSFAGQQESFLNVVGADSLERAVVECWASLWTARAIGYRMRNAVPAAGLALAVAVQRMVPSESSGVLFTANPLSGSRRETVIDATFGLGEALVAGKVEPDHYVVWTEDGRILSKTLGAKVMQIRVRTGGGTESSLQNSALRPALSDDQIVELAKLGERARALFASPQDIEWALADGKFSLVQSRPITSLFPVPEGLPDGKLRVFFSFAAVQGMQDPMTPLGRDSLKMIVSVAARLFGVRNTSETQTVFYTAGERIWMNVTPLLKNSVGRRIVPVVTALVEPAIGQAVLQLRDEPQLQPGRAGVSLPALFRLARFVVPLGFNIALNLIAPRRRREYIVANGERLLEEEETICAGITGDRYQRLDRAINLLPDLAAGNLPHTFILFVSGVAAGMVSWNALNMLARRAMDDPSARAGVQDLVLQVTRGMPYNPTTEMDLALWRMAKAVRGDPESLRVFQQIGAAELRERYRAGALPPPAMQAVGRFLETYGGRGLGEIDLGRTRWAEDPTHVFESLLNFLRIEDENMAPDAVFARAAKSAQEAVDNLAAAVRKTPGGWIKARLVRFFAGRARQLMGVRESPKFFAVRMMYKIHRELLSLGREFVAGGELAQDDDLFFLRISEIRAFAARGGYDPRGMIAARREAYERELRRRQIPRLLLSDGRAFYEGMTSAEDSSESIVGSPVSPGVAEGGVRVVLDPRSATLEPGEILVCPGTDPSWTPLFLSAGALVMETGGMMTHGSVVAREYGIPAVVGVHAATTRLHTGQRVRVDGSKGIIEVLDQAKTDNEL